MRGTAVTFIAAGVVFHLLLGSLVVLIARRWQRWAEKPSGTWLWLTRMAANSVLFGNSLFLLAVLFGLSVPVPGLAIRGLTVLQFAAQGLFGEGVVLVGWLSLVHFRAPGDPSGRVRRPAWRGGLLAGVTAALVMVYADAYHREPYTLQVRHYALDLSHGRPDAGTLRIVHLSDIQAHRVRPYEARVFREVRALHPDLLVYTGDYVQNRVFNTRPRAFTDFNALLRRWDLHPPFGAYAVRGDADWDDWTHLFDGTGVRCLSNKSARVALPGGRVLTLVGLDLGTGRRKDPAELHRVLDSAPNGDLRLVVAHAPDL